MGDSLSATTIRLDAHSGDSIEAYLARPDGDARRGGVVVIHHMPGYDRASKEIARRFAELGFDAICPNLHYREAPGAAPDDAAAASRAAGGVPDDRLVGDVGAATEYLRALPTFARLGLPATVFVPLGYVGTERLLVVGFGGDVDQLERPLICAIEDVFGA